MLPSPRWPNGTGREPGMSFTTAALASSMKAGTAATGTEMSCLIEPPSGFCAADISSRSFQNPARWEGLAAAIGGLHRMRLRKQFERRRGDDAERAFGADEEVAQIVAGVVLLQLREPIQDPAIGKHHFQPERHLARHAIRQGRSAAGIG